MRPEGYRPLTVRELAERLGCPFEGDGEVLLRDVAALESAGDGDLAFLANPRWKPRLDASRAAAAVVPPLGDFGPRPLLRSSDPRRTFLRAVGLFYTPFRPAPGIHPLADVAPTARLGSDVSVGPFCSIGAEARIGDRTVLFPFACVYPGVRIGRDCVLHAHVSIREECAIGDRVIIHNGAVIGADGFGYLQEEDGRQTKIPQRGRTVIEDDVEIGANSCIDRAALGVTRVARGVKIDDLVMVAHNVEIGENSVLAAQAGIAGSSRLGRNVILSGQVGVADHITLGDRTVVAAQGGVISSVQGSGQVLAGTPHLDIRDWRKIWVLLPRLPALVKELKDLRARLEALESGRKTE